MIYNNLELLPENLHGWNGEHNLFEVVDNNFWILRF